MTVIPQAIFDCGTILDRSPGFDDRLANAVSELLLRLEPSADDTLVALPIGKRNWAVVQTRGSMFGVLAVPSPAYQLIADPFLIAQQLPADFGSRFPLSNLMLDVSPPQRRLDSLRAILKSDDGATLLGAAQALVDGGRVVFERPKPAPETLQRLWLLLPESSRGELRVATFAVNNELGFDLLVTPKAKGASFVGCLTDTQAGDYPQGRYELNLQIAVESGDEVGLSRLLARRSSRQALRLMLHILILAVIVGLASRILLR
ncbi:MAG: hypothetical protein ACJ8C4_10825 [Gemmataceae bacterium]